MITMQNIQNIRSLDAPDIHTTDLSASGTAAGQTEILDRGLHYETFWSWSRRENLREQKIGSVGTCIRFPNITGCRCCDPIMLD